MYRSEKYAIISAISAAVLFGIVIPFSKFLLTGIGPITLAALLYLGAGLGLLTITGLIRTKGERIEAEISRDDILWIIIIVIAGSIIGPILLMTGLTSVPAGTASLLLNGELVMTVIIAGLFFAEPLGSRTLLATILVLTGGLILSYDPGGDLGISAGIVLILGACLCWGIDNNATRLLSGKDPAMIAIIKGFGAGIFGIFLAIGLREPAPSLILVGSALLIGLFGYGFSILLFIRSLRVLGAVRTGSLFALAPFIGVIASYPILGEVPGVQTLICLPLMAGGVYLIASEDHSHLHSHLPASHDHRHSHHDHHHTHIHDIKNPGEHAHPHQHLPKTHNHGHTPDLHHHHTHDKKDERGNI
ncbi:MAG: DMT family transporter [Methanobacteriota archaeon]